MADRVAAAAPAVVGRYAVYGEIAAGGMATVHLGRLIGQAGFSRTVAIKRLHRTLSEDPEFSAMLLDEARLASRVRHPNVVPTLDVVSTGAELFLVMEYVHGVSLATLLRALAKRDERVEPRIGVAILAAVLHGLHAAHEATDESGASLGIVHRDVSPQNVLVGADGVARVLDFGVAKARGRLQTTHDGRLKGKLAYMAPEQLRSRACDRRSDVFAAGVVLWEVLTGKRLFTADTEGEIVEKVLYKPIDPPSVVRPELGTRFDAVTMCAMDRDAERRYANARLMALDLEACETPASPTQVSAWVESLAGDTLSSRMDQVKAVESSPAIAAAGEAVVELTPSARDRREEPTKVETGPGSGASQAHLAVSRPSQRGQARQTKSPWIGVAALVAALGVAAAASLALRSSRGTETPTATVPLAAAASTAAQSASTAATSAASASAEPVVSAESASSPSASAEPVVAPSGRAPSHAVAAPARSSRPQTDCSEPYTRDALGRKIYKMECLH